MDVPGRVVCSFADDKMPSLMAASAEIITKPVASAISLRWIISARDDAIWFIGSVVSSYLLLFLYVWGIVPLVPMVAFWGILIDAAPAVVGNFLVVVLFISH